MVMVLLAEDDYIVGAAHYFCELSLLSCLHNYFEQMQSPYSYVLGFMAQTVMLRSDGIATSWCLLCALNTACTGQSWALKKYSSGSVHSPYFFQIPPTSYPSTLMCYLVSRHSSPLEASLTHVAPSELIYSRLLTQQLVP